jgi:hypothetical protein
MKKKANPEEHFCPHKECPNYGKKGPGKDSYLLYERFERKIRIAHPTLTPHP